MAEIKFTIYGDQPSPLENLDFLLQEFQKQQHVTVRVERLEWEAAWPKLLNYALYGGGPHVSQIGSVWTSTLVAMNALRPFAPREIDELGGTAAFLEPTWQTAVLPQSPVAWGIPFTGFTYIMLYRRDFLRRAGVSEATAFNSPAALLETVRCLQAAGIPSPIALPSGSPFRARVHIAASWLWGAGGHFVSDDERQAQFDQPAARAGLKSFFQLYFYLAPHDYHLTYNDCLQRFAQGQTALTIASTTVLPVLQTANVPEVMEHLGSVVLPGVPWIGGSNLVVWREAQMYPGIDRAALALVKFLTSHAAQLKYAQTANAIPARQSTLDQLCFEPAALHETIKQSLHLGRCYRPVLIWVRMINDLSYAFDAMTAEVLAQRDIDEVLGQHLGSLAQRYNLMLLLDHLVHPA
jgi:multiple sugar transport system substrate-binding protein